jgi:hypothetical protein|tara:strand:+ start:3141 stop:3344 length:204 start_codon:yes stop_codon:yes gene_type:complete
MGTLNVKGGVKIVEGKAFIHPLSYQEIEFLLEIVANAGHKIEDMPKVMQVTKKLRNEYKLIIEHFEE